MSAPAAHAEEIRGTPQACFDALVDFESYPAWQSAVKRARVRGRGPETADVEFEIDLHVRVVRYALRYTLAPPSALTWELLDGDVRRVDGGYDLEEVRPGVTLATYRLDIDPGFPLPGLLRRRLVGGTMARSVRELRDRVEAA